jgi:DNA-binding PadR family transcriptional regulator
MTDESDQLGVGAEIVGTTVATIIGTLVGGPVGGVAGAAAARPVSELVQKSWAELVAFRERNLQTLISETAEQSGIDPEEILRAAAEDPQVNRLFQASLVAAAEALDREKVEALAKCLANGIGDAARVDEESVMVRALADLDPVHVRVLAWIEESPKSTYEVHEFIAGDSDSPTYLRVPNLALPVLTILERNGLASIRQQGAEEIDAGAHPKYAATDFGRECLQRLGHHTSKTRRQIVDGLMKHSRDGLRRDQS